MGGVRWAGTPGSEVQMSRGFRSDGRGGGLFRSDGQGVQVS